MSDPAAPLSPVKQALVEIRRLRAQLAERQARDAEPIAIVGAAIRFPGGIARLDDFWSLLADGAHAITEAPPGRWREDRAAGTIRRGGFVDGIDRFDAAFFGITPREAESMDPQHRILLELTWEALEHAGIPPTSLSGTQAGVFVGLSNSDYGRMLLERTEDIDAYSSFGLAESIAAGRLSYVLDARGPSLVVDTACSSGLMAVHVACRSLASGESSLAVVGGANLMLAPEVTLSFSNARMLSADGQCKTFDADADGYVRSEGCAVVILKRLRDAQADGDRVLAVIRGSAANHDGRSAGLTAPNGPAQAAVIQAALRNAKLAPADVDYVEAHGTGTPLGDPIEVQALAAAYGPGRAADKPLLVGSVKTNVGHLEAVAGLAGLLKVVLSLRHDRLPMHRNVSALNPRVAWHDLPVSVVTAARSWARTERPRRAGVSAFGFSGTNVHVIVEEAPTAVRGTEPPVNRPELFLLSARSPEALRALAADYGAWLDRSDAPLAAICHAVSVSRSHHRHRLAAIVRDRAELAACLRNWCDGLADGRIVSAETEQPAPQVGIFCPAPDGAGAPAPDGAGAMDPDGMPAAFMDAAARSPADLQLALGRFWMSAGIAPAAVFGVGSGEIAAATLAGLRPAGTARPTGAAFISTRTGRIETAWTEGDGDSRLDAAIAAAASAGADVLLVLGDDSACAAGTIARRAVCHTVMDETIWQGVIQAARTLYLAGVDLAWDVFHRLPGQAGARPVLDLPTYAFQRQRYWRPADPVTAAAEKPVQATPGFDWSRLVSAVAQQSETGPLGWDVTRFDARWRAVDALTAGYAIDTLAGFGEFAQPGARATAEDILRRHGIAPGYRNLVYRWMLLLARDGVLQDEGNGVFVSPSPLRRRDLAAAWQAVERLMADDPDMLDYARRTCGKLVDLLTGRTNPLEVLFARGSLDMAEGIYERSPSARYLNAMVASAVRSALADHRGDEPFRLVEAGAGTGGTTSCLAEFFPADGEYWFTDLSDVFLTRAQRRFGKNPAFRFNRLDLEQAPPAELPVGQADVVLAANVIHATRDLAVTLDNMRALLKPGGLLVLLESTTHHSMLDLSIGFVEGWNRFDDAYRSFHPLLDADRWTALLRERGFVTAERFPKAGSVTDRIGQHVIVARNDLDMRAVAAIKRSAPVEAVAAFVAEPVQADKPLEAIGREALERIVRHCAAQVMHLDPATRPGPRERFSDLGMDSLMALQLQTDLSKALGLGDRLPATIAFDTGTVEGLTDEILRLAAPARPEAEPVPVVRATLPGVKSAADLADMSDEEVEALLAQRVLANQMVVSR